MADKERLLRERYEAIALSGDDNTTAEDFLLRELEIDFAAQYMRDGDRLLDVGCGLGYALRQYASRFAVEAVGLDYAENMVAMARKRTAELASDVDITFRQGSVTELPFGDGEFDVVTSHRCLMALLDWEKQKKALQELARVLKPNGMLVLMEGTQEGIDRLNAYRRLFDLGEIDASGSARLLTRKLRESELLEFVRPLFGVERIQRFGMYYFLTRIVQPLLVAPEAPRYDHPLNRVARDVARIVTDFEGIGHLVGFALRKKA